ncbi:MAG: matrixin family metalloprotease [DPANN group archaeon]|nr:matrixin family metalloprotease [DPANN group archaeon]
MKNKTILFSVLVITLLLISATVAAYWIIPASDMAKSKAKAPEMSPVIDEYWDIEKIEFVHNFDAKPSKPGKPSGQDLCYKLMGIKWKTLPVSYTINPVNPYNLTPEFITGAISKSAEIWDSETTAEIFSESYTIDYSATYGVQDYKNSVVFGNGLDSNTIAVTTVWYTRRGKQILEFDMKFNTDYVWGNASEMPEVMDLENIAIHEIGHAFGLADIYTMSCSAVTMYGYSSYGETNKQTLEQPDITGLQAIYGP